ncbi:MAG: trigger factor [Thermoleophilaceae bacterium]
MPAELTTTLTELDPARVRVDVEVEPTAVEREIDRAARSLAGDMKVPGFRRGKAPTPVVLQRLGRAAVLEEAMREALPEWYEEAVISARVAPVGRPDLALHALPDKGGTLAFSFEVGVVPPATLGAYRGVEVPRPEAEVETDAVDAEIDRVRDSLAALESVERPAQRGDFVVVDFVGSIDGEPFEGGEARGSMLELGSERLIPGFEEQLVGASAEDEREVSVTFPEDYGAEHLAGREATFAVAVREVKEKRPPELDDDFAAEAGGFDSVDELREDVESRMREAREGQIDTEFRAAAIDAVLEQATVDIPHDLVHAKAHDMWAATGRRLRAQGIDPERFLEATGKTEEEIAAEHEPEAERALGRESVLAAIVEAEGIDASDDELLDSLRESATAHSASHGHDPPDDDELRDSLARSKEDGRDEELRADVRMRKAVDLVVEHARAVPAAPAAPAEAEAGEKLWTPDSEEPAESGAAPGELWTPGS